MEPRPPETRRSTRSRQTLARVFTFDGQIKVTFSRCHWHWASLLCKLWTFMHTAVSRIIIVFGVNSDYAKRTYKYRRTNSVQQTLCNVGVQITNTITSRTHHLFQFPLRFSLPRSFSAVKVDRSCDSIFPQLSYSRSSSSRNLVLSTVYKTYSIVILGVNVSLLILWFRCFFT